MLILQFELTGSNLDKKDVFSESDPYFTISRVNPDGSDTLVYRSEWIKVSNVFRENIQPYLQYPGLFKKIFSNNQLSNVDVPTVAH